MFDFLFIFSICILFMLSYGLLVLCDHLLEKKP